MAKLVAVINPDQADEVASGLLERFGSLSKLLTVSYEALQSASASKAVANLIVAARQAVYEGMHQEMIGRAFDPRTPEFSRYIMTTLGNCRNEVLKGFFLDSQKKIIAEHILGEGISDSISISTKFILRIALRMDASHMVLLHNHPSGYEYPSEQDRKFTQDFQASAAAVGVGFLDHLVVTRCAIFSIRLGGVVSRRGGKRT